MTKETQLQIINEIFSPSAPINDIKLFVGRNHQLEKIADAFNERGQHAVMYGARGAGKTSLANILENLFQNVLVIKVTCHRSDDFTSIWEKAITKIRIMTSRSGVGFKAEKKQVFATVIDEMPVEINPTHIETLLQELWDTAILFVFDEFDSITKKKTKVEMADTIKMLSDNVPNATLLIVGIADNVSQLIGKHPSIERCIKQIHIPLMDEQEAREIVHNVKYVGLSVAKEVEDKIIDYSCGFPHYIHLLCKYAAVEAVRDEAQVVSMFHFDKAVEHGIENSNHSLRQAFQTAIQSSRRKTQFEDVIYACTLAAKEAATDFTSEDIIAHFNQITNKEIGKESINYNLGMLCKPDRGEILMKKGRSKDTQYRFKNPLMKAYIKLQWHKATSKQ